MIFTVVLFIFAHSFARFLLRAHNVKANLLTKDYEIPLFINSTNNYSTLYESFINRYLLYNPKSGTLEFFFMHY